MLLSVLAVGNRPVAAGSLVLGNRGADRSLMVLLRPVGSQRAGSQVVARLGLGTLLEGESQALLLGILARQCLQPGLVDRYQLLVRPVLQYQGRSWPPPPLSLPLPQDHLDLSAQQDLLAEVRPSSMRRLLRHE